MNTRKSFAAITFGIVCLLCSGAPCANEQVLGEWDIEYSTPRGQSTAKLAITKKDDGTPAGVWTSGRGTSEVADLKFDDGKLTFVHRFAIQGREMSMAFTGKIEGGGLTGEFVSSRGNTPVSGTPSGAAAGPGDPTAVSRRGQAPAASAPQAKPGAAVVKPGYPVFSWDTVPVYIPCCV